MQLKMYENTWTPPELNVDEIVRQAKITGNTDAYLYIFKTQPYIDTVLIAYGLEHEPVKIKRFTFHEGYTWDPADEVYFGEHCIKNDGCGFSGGPIESIYKAYHAMHPEWHLRRYYAKGLRLLDHIYHCMRQNTAKEILYKAGLDELAVHVDEIDELNLLSNKPSDLYDGLSMRVLRSLNSRYGVNLLKNHTIRVFLKELNGKFPKFFTEKLNDAQCLYLNHLITGELTVGETGRLFESRRQFLSKIWSVNYYYQVLQEEKGKEWFRKYLDPICEIDPIYEKYIRENKKPRSDRKISRLIFLLLMNRDENNRAVRRANRKRNDEWQERGKEYFVRYPQTVNDFCREAIYMQNCLLTYYEAMIGGDTTILFMRKADDVNQPFITIEIYKNVLMQAYHRFNEDCTSKEAAWILDYCDRHKIDTGKFKFNVHVDQLF